MCRPDKLWSLRHLITLHLFVVVAASAAAQDVDALYTQHCSVCHDNPTETRAPSKTALKGLSPVMVLKALDSGSMAAQAKPLSAEQRREMAEYLSGRTFDEVAQAPTTQGACEAEHPKIGDPFEGPSWTGWSANLTNSRYVPAEVAGLDPADVGKLELKWAFGMRDAKVASAQPTIAAGRVFIASMTGMVHALDAETGCQYWSFQAPDRVRTSMTLGLVEGQASVFFGDYKANLYALDARTGALLWRVDAEKHPYSRFTGSPVYHEGRVYAATSSVEEGPAGQPDYSCCTFRGAALALDANTGEILWKTHTIVDEAKPVAKKENGKPIFGPSGAAVWSPPTMDLATNSVIVATGNHYTDRGPDGDPVESSDSVIAFDMNTGERKWLVQFTKDDLFSFGCGPRNQFACTNDDGPDFDFGAPPVLHQFDDGRRLLLLGQKSGEVHAVDPDREGAIVWQSKVAKGGKLGGIEWGLAANPKLVFAAISDPNRRKPDEAGGLVALQIATGEEIWRTPAPDCDGCMKAQMAAVTAIPGVVFSGSMDGHLRAYSDADGRIIWDYDTAREFETVNGVTASGGSLNAAGPTVVGGLVFVSSGYTQWRGKPGNVLLAFGVPGE